MENEPPHVGGYEDSWGGEGDRITSRQKALPYRAKRRSPKEGSSNTRISKRLTIPIASLLFPATPFSRTKTLVLSDRWKTSGVPLGRGVGLERTRVVGQKRRLSPRRRHTDSRKLDASSFMPGKAPARLRRTNTFRPLH